MCQPFYASHEKTMTVRDGGWTDDESTQFGRMSSPRHFVAKQVNAFLEEPAWACPEPCRTQVASILTCVVTASAAIFSYHCMLQRMEAAAVHPPLMFFLLAVLLLLPIDAVYKVG